MRILRPNAAVSILAAMALAVVFGVALYRQAPAVLTTSASRSIDGRLPTPEELDSLTPYLAPTQPAPKLDDYAAFLPAAAPPSHISYEAAPAPEVVPDWHLGAILIAGGEPVAILDNETVKPGSTLDDGSRVVSIARDRMVIRTPRGTLHTLRLTAE